MSNQRQLLVGAKPEKDESFLGFILRLTDINTLAKPTWILERLGDSPNALLAAYSFVFGQQMNLEPLTELIGVEESEIENLRYPLIRARWQFDEHLFRGLAISGFMLRLKLPKVCPGCLQEANYCRAIWDLAPFTTCPIHSCLLLDSCPNCNKSLNWSRNKVSSCLCSFDLRKTKIISVPSKEQALSGYIYSLCGFTDKGKFNSKENPLYGLSLRDLSRVLFFIAGQYKGVMNTTARFIPPKFTNLDLHSELRHAFNVFEDFPKNYFAFLDWLRKENRVAEWTPGVQREFGKFPQAIYKRLEGDEFEFLRSSFEDYVKTKWSETYIANIKRQSGEVIVKERFITKTQARHILHLNRKQLEEFIKAGRLKGQMCVRITNRKFLIDTESVDKLKNALKKSAELLRASVLLGVSRPVVEGLIENGCLTPFHPSGESRNAIWTIPNKALAELLTTLESKVQKRKGESEKSLIALTSIFNKLIWTGLTAAEFVRCVINDEIKPYSTSAGTGLNRFMFTEREVGEFIRVRRIVSTGEDICISEIAGILGLPVKRATKFANSGFFGEEKESKIVRNSKAFSRKVFEQFHSTYIPALTISHEARTSEKALIKALSLGGIHPITKKGMSVYKRADLANVDIKSLVLNRKKSLRSINERSRVRLRGYVDSKQAAKILGVSVEVLGKLIKNGVLKCTQKTLPGSSNKENYYSPAHLNSLKAAKFDITKVVSTSKASELLKRSKSNIHQHIYNGNLRLARLHNKGLRYVFKDSIDEFLEKIAA